MAPGLAAILLIFVVPTDSIAQEPERAPVDAAAAVESDHGDADADAAEAARRAAKERARRERVVASGLLAIVGIAIIGGMLIIVTILWGGSLRKRVRTAPRATPPQDELWYLRKPKPEDSESVKTEEPPSDDAKPQA
ncbi:MAG: hypothetical protein WD066_13660 [Planctomycetaceae bacterium]